ncbi:LysR family transcriptional regulator [Geodermatophilus amargosae]|uniref:LysR family transcriptional regulator n=1 Tax=Geodermatophilus amargosae TaxID=1296565 RepID=UPI000B87C054|nr:LysR family transcriptional regulator [Geodermatophilus amargosae]
MDPEVRQLRALLAVVDTGTFTAAAAALHTTQASVSRTVAALERALGTRVLHRTTRTVALTPAGIRVAAHARRVLEEVAALRRTAERARDELRIGYAWAALGRHTAAVQRAWADAHPGAALLFVQSNTPTAGLTEGLADVAVLRRPPGDPRLATAEVGRERRYAVVAADDPLARRRSVRLADLTGRVLASDGGTGTTTRDLWTATHEPAAIRDVRGVDAWLTAIAAGQAAGVTTEATARQHPRPGVVYRPLRDAPWVPVRLAWWADSPPPDLADLVALVRARLARDGTGNKMATSPTGNGSTLGA